MTIQSGDIKILASKVMDDVPEGGGGPSGTVIPDNNSNAVFTDVSEVDRAGGAASIRQVHTHVQTPDVDRFLGAHIIVSRIPNDANVAVTLAECNPFDRRTDIATAIENYLIQGPEWSGYLFENHVQGQRSIQLFQRPGTPTPPIGRTLVLIKDEGLGTEYKQYVRVTSVETEDRTFTYTTGGGYVDYPGTVVTCDISDALREAFPGSTANRGFGREPNKTIVRDTTVADAATYYGAVPLSAAASLGDIGAKVVGIYSQLVPSARTETIALDQKPAAQRLLTLATTPRRVEVPIVPHSLRIGVGQENRGFSWVQMLKPLPAPGTVVVSFMALGNWYTVQDDGAGGFVGSGTGTINYATGSIAVTFPSMPDAGSSVLFQWGENTAFADRKGDARVRPPEYSLVLPQHPLVPGQTVITWSSGGVPRTATDNGSGSITGDAMGEIAYATGHLRIRPSHMVDAGGEMSVDYVYKDEFVQVYEHVVPDGAGFALLTLPQEPAPNSVSVRWITTRIASTSAGSTEAVTSGLVSGTGPGVPATAEDPTTEDVVEVEPGGAALECLTASVAGVLTPGASAQYRFYQANTEGDAYTWEATAYTRANALLPVTDLVSGAASGSWTMGATFLHTFGFSVAPSATYGNIYVKVRDSTLAAVATLRIAVAPSAPVVDTAAMLPPADTVRTTSGVAAVSAMRLGGVDTSGAPVYVSVPPLHDAILGHVYDPPSPASVKAVWSADDIATGKTLITSRGSSTHFVPWGR